MINICLGIRLTNIWILFMFESWKYEYLKLYIALRKLILFFNHRSYWWHAFGLQNYWTKKLSREASQCQLKYNSNGESIKVVDKVRIKLGQLYVVFYILFTCYLWPSSYESVLWAIKALLWENYIFYYKVYFEYIKGAGSLNAQR